MNKQILVLVFYLLLSNISNAQYLNGLNFNSIYQIENSLTPTNNSNISKIICLSNEFTLKDKTIWFNDKLIDDHLTIKNENRGFPKIGLQIGSHSSNVNNSISKFGSGIIIEAFLKFEISNEVHLVPAFTYWKASTNEINSQSVQIPAEIINSKGFKLGVDFSLINIYDMTLSLEPSVIIEKITISKNAVLTFGASLKLNIPVLTKIDMFPVINYRNGMEALALGGGGFDYSFISYQVGIKINLMD